MLIRRGLQNMNRNKGGFWLSQWQGVLCTLVLVPRSFFCNYVLGFVVCHCFLWEYLFKNWENKHQLMVVGKDSFHHCQKILLRDIEKEIKWLIEINELKPDQKLTIYHMNTLYHMLYIYCTPDMAALMQQI